MLNPALKVSRPTYPTSTKSPRNPTISTSKNQYPSSSQLNEPPIAYLTTDFNWCFASDHSSRFPFPPGTALFPNHTFVLQYHKSIISHWNLASYIRLRHQVLEADWRGDNVTGHWHLTTLDRTHNRTTHGIFDHLIVANGHYHYPYEPRFQGRQVWEASAPSRKILHSIYYREPEAYRARNILIVGGGASGRDIARQVVVFANSVWITFTCSRPILPFGILLTDNLPSFRWLLDIRFFKK